MVSQAGCPTLKMGSSKLANYGDLNGGVLQKFQNRQKRSDFFDYFLKISKVKGRA